MATVQRDIELRPHTGIDRAGRKVTFVQDQIFLNGMRVGYVGHTPGEGICLIRPMDDATKKAVMEVVEKARGAPPKYAMTAPVIESREEAGRDDE